MSALVASRRIVLQADRKEVKVGVEMIDLKANTSGIQSLISPAAAIYLLVWTDVLRLLNNQYRTIDTGRLYTGINSPVSKRKTASTRPVCHVQHQLLGPLKRLAP